MGFTLPSPEPGVAPSRDSQGERIRRAWESGVTLFDVARARDPSAALALLDRALPSVGPELTVLLPGGSTAAGSQWNRERRWHTLPEFSAGELAARPAAGPLASPEVARLEGSETSLPASDPLRLYACAYSLLDRRVASLFASTPAGDCPAFVRDPFARGRLDGSRWAGTWIEGGPSSLPPSYRGLESEFAPVLRLGFLTEGRQRTLAQAAVQYAASPAWVASVLVPLPSADRLAELLGSFGRPALSRSELARVDALPDPGGLVPSAGRSNRPGF